MNQKKLYAGMEGGGTKFVCAVGTSPKNIIEEYRFPTTTPDETLGRAITFFKKFDLTAIGLAPFGPVDLNPLSPTYGSIMNTPKFGWANTDVIGPFRTEFNIPTFIELDVNAAVLGEYFWIPENRRFDSLVYYTIGTGIGAGIIINKKLVHGQTHPEAGHLQIPHNRKADPFPGICPFHGDCFEGLASGPALAKRWRKPSDLLPNSHPAWVLEAFYISHALVNTIVLLSPQRIVLGGGVMGRQLLFPLIRQKVQHILNSYILSPALANSMEEFIVPPALGNLSGILGAVALAKIMSSN
jgi:fructokinase